MIGGIITFITGALPALLNFGKTLADLRVAKIKANTDVELAKVNQDIEELHDRRAALIALAGTRFGNACIVTIQTIIGFWITLLLGKLWVWDKVVGSFMGCAGAFGKPQNCYWFRTDPLDTNQWILIGCAISFYFMTRFFKQ